MVGHLAEKNDELPPALKCHSVCRKYRTKFKLSCLASQMISNICIMDGVKNWLDFSNKQSPFCAPPLRSRPLQIGATQPKPAKQRETVHVHL